MPHALLIFIKNPIPGKTKTRLAAQFGDDMALRMYARLLEHTRQAAQAVAARRLLFYSDFIDFRDAWPAASFHKHLQAPGDLGERMAAAFNTALVDADRALIIGSDCPGISADLLETAFTALDTHDLVIGPARDGGYYLLGMKRLYPALFEHMTWSTDTVYAQTRSRADQAQLKVEVLPVLSDVDYLEDWLSYGWGVPV